MYNCTEVKFRTVKILSFFVVLKFSFSHHVNYLERLELKHLRKLMHVTLFCLKSLFLHQRTQEVVVFTNGGFVCRLIAVESDLLQNVLVRLKYCEQEEKVVLLFC